MVDMTVNEFIDASTTDLRDRISILTARLDKGWTYSGEAADCRWLRLLAEYERVCDELRRKGQVVA